MRSVDRSPLLRAVTRHLGRLTRLSDATMTAVFVGLTVTAALAALTLGVRAARQQLPVELGEERVSREGGETIVRVTVRNRTEDVLCPEIRIAARDREGLDLDEQIARPRDSSERLEPERRKLYEAVFRDLSEQELAEELDEFTAYLVPDSEECSPAGTGGA